ncbi:hypothetical protein ACIP98_33930 [Streptomyces sp. NPDC088354]|uniref:hypothetical protein n=1 Tax=Streptomyces sp. NPDC088354 TaxID=3365856 RepID=UPI003811CCB6
MVGVHRGLGARHRAAQRRFVHRRASDYCIAGSSGARLAFLEREPKAARASCDIDWIAVAMH